MYEVIEAEVRDGHIIPCRTDKIPKSGKALVLILPKKEEKPDLRGLRELLGWLKTDIDAAEWQRSVRDEWDDRL